MAEPSSSVVVFAGPTLHGVPRTASGFTWNGPARRGDVYQASLARPRAIALVDGYFDQTPSVWHKEILAVLAVGIRVFGAASVGALRAAELAPYGMRGVGRIYDMFADGTLEDDDEVAIAHAAAEDGYRPLSVAMVDIRATLASAEQAGVIGAATRAALCAAAKQRHFPERSYPRLLADGSGPIAAAELGRLEAWLPANAVQQKRADAVALLDGLTTGAIDTTQPLDVSFAFQRTHVWEAMRSRIEIEWAEREGAGQAARGSAGVNITSWRGALLRAAAREEAERRWTSIDQAVLDGFVEGFRRERGLLTAEAFAAWLASVGLATDADITRFFTGELLFRGLCARLSVRARAELADDGRASAPGTVGRPVPQSRVDE